MNTGQNPGRSPQTSARPRTSGGASRSLICPMARVCPHAARATGRGTRRGAEHGAGTRPGRLMAVASAAEPRHARHTFREFRP